MAPVMPVKIVTTFAPSPLTATTATAAIKATTRPYSTSVAPSSSVRTFVRFLSMLSFLQKVCGVSEVWCEESDDDYFLGHSSRLDEATPVGDSSSTMCA